MSSKHLIFFSSSHFLLRLHLSSFLLFPLLSSSPALPLTAPVQLLFFYFLLSRSFWPPFPPLPKCITFVSSFFYSLLLYTSFLQPKSSRLFSGCFSLFFSSVLTSSSLLQLVSLPSSPLLLPSTFLTCLSFHLSCVSALSFSCHIQTGTHTHTHSLTVSQKIISLWLAKPPAAMLDQPLSHHTNQDRHPV